jgi:hypothetical protein
LGLECAQLTDEIAKVINCTDQGENTKSCGGNRMPAETSEYEQQRNKRESLAESGF